MLDFASDGTYDYCVGSSASGAIQVRSANGTSLGTDKSDTSAANGSAGPLSYTDAISYESTNVFAGANGRIWGKSTTQTTWTLEYNNAGVTINHLFAYRGRAYAAGTKGYGLGVLFRRVPYSTVTAIDFVGQTHTKGWGYRWEVVNDPSLAYVPCIGRTAYISGISRMYYVAREVYDNDVYRIALREFSINS